MSKHLFLFRAIRRVGFLGISAATILFGAVQLAADAAQAADCGGLNERACCIGAERRGRTDLDGGCGQGLVEKGHLSCEKVLGSDAACRCEEGIVRGAIAGVCVAITSCGGEGERACCVGDAGGAGCDAGLIERGDCEGELGPESCFCPAALLNTHSFGICEDDLCGGVGEKQCCPRDRNGSLLERCEPGPDPDYPLIPIFGCAGPGGGECTCNDGGLPSVAPRTCILPTECGGPGQRACCSIEKRFESGAVQTSGDSAGCEPGLLAFPGCVGDCFCGNAGTAGIGDLLVDVSNATCSPDPGEAAQEEPTTDHTPFFSVRSCPLEGFADIHAHQFSHLAHGGNLFVGSTAPIDPSGSNCPDGEPGCFALTPSLNVADALNPIDDLETHDRHLLLSCPIAPDVVSSPDTPAIISDLLTFASSLLCPGGPDAEPTNQDPIGKGTNDVAFAPFGFPVYNAWPHWRTTTHQQMYYKWLERAYLGGMRLMVQLNVTNEALCRATGGEDCTDSMKAVDEQIDAAFDFERFIDDLEGGPGQGWYRIVTSPLQAREVIADGKMAVVLGIEMDHPFNCSIRDGAGCPDPDLSHPAEKCLALPEEERRALPAGSSLTEVVDWYYDCRGIRHVFPIHNFDNAFGRTATWQNAINTGQAIAVKQWQQTRDCSADGYGFSMNSLLVQLVGLFGFEAADSAGTPEAPDYPESASCNTQGLSDLGLELLDALSDRGMIIDVDHMSIHAFDDTVEHTRARYPDTGYPLVASHVQSFDLHRNVDDYGRHERMRTLAQLEAIRDSGGMIAAMTKDDVQDTGDKGKDVVVDYVPELAPAIPNTCRHSSVTYAQAYQYAVDTMQAPVALGIDFNGTAGHVGPRFGTEACGAFTDPLLEAFLGGIFPRLVGDPAPEDVRQERSFQIQFSPRVRYPFFRRGYGVFDRQQTNLRTFDFNVDGLAHVGLLPDLVEDLRLVRLGDAYMQALFNSAEEYVRVWERSESVATGEPIPERPESLSCGPPAALCLAGDDTPPDLTCADLVAECGGATTDVDFGPEGAADECGSVSVSCSPESPGAFPLGATEINCTAADESQNTADCSFAVTVEDTTPPSLTAPPDLADVECTSPSGASPPLGDPDASDVCDASAAVTNDAPDVFPLGLTTVTWTAADASGNATDALQTVTVVDTTPPTHTCPSDVTIECSESAEPWNTGEPTVTDVCDLAPGTSRSDAEVPGACADESVVTRTWSATDASGNAAEDCDQVIEVVDTTAPAIACNAPPTVDPTEGVDEDEAQAAPVSFTATATDNCDPSVTVEVVDFDCFALTRRGVRIDKTGSCAVALQGDTVTILDSGGVGNTITWTVRATDRCGEVSSTVCQVDVENPTPAP